MAYTLTHLAATGGTYYGILGTASLADWTTARQALTEGSGANVGRYTASVSSLGPWFIFSGASQPSTWADYVAISEISVVDSIVLSPVAGNAPDRVEETTLKAFVGETWSEQVGGLDADGNVIDWTALGSLEFVLENSIGTDVVVIADGDITKASTYFQVSIGAAYVGTVPTTMKWAIRQTSNNNVVLYGNFVVGYAADGD